MSQFRKILAAMLLVCSGLVSCFSADEEPDAGTRWVCVYGWLQIGERLAGADQWPLALGSYIEAHRQLDELAKDQPEFEPEIVSYRLLWLEEEIGKTQDRLDSGEHDIMMKYLDFIESFELGQSQRFNNDFKTALATLDIAKTLLDEIIAKKPDEFRHAMAVQYDLLLDSIIWLNSQINFKERSRSSSFVNDTSDLGTTEFIRESDLPVSYGGAMASGALFPESLIEAVAASYNADSPVGVTPPAEDKVGRDQPRPVTVPSFRMSSKENSVKPGSEPPGDQ